MELEKKRVITLVADLWADKYPLVKRYFGKYLELLIDALIADPPFEGRFVHAAFDPESLENLLNQIESVHQTDLIIREVGQISDPIILDDRLMAAWAELRTIKQLLKEGFSDIRKVKDVADLTAIRDGRKFAFQVKRIGTELSMQFPKRNSPTQMDTNPEGELTKLIDRFDSPLYLFFRNALTEKNNKFKNWTEPNCTRVIVLVTGDEALQDPFTRHLACKKLREIIHSEILTERHFEEVIWFPDTSNGAIFVVGKTSQETRCFADWCDDPNVPLSDRKTKVNRREVNLESDIARWV
jgi:hypothetical protein